MVNKPHIRKDQAMTNDTQRPNGIHPIYPSLSLSILTFHLAGQVYGLPVTEVVQIIEMVSLTHLLQAPLAIQGLINLRGKIVPVMDLRLRFELPFKPYRLHTPIILAHLKGQILGLIVDMVEAVVEISAADLEPGDKVISSILSGPLPDQKSYLAGVANVKRRLIPILKTETLLSQAEQTRLLEQIAINDQAKVGE
jgi:purine-binding chemotaxis protein CheW